MHSCMFGPARPPAHPPRPPPLPNASAPTGLRFCRRTSHSLHCCKPGVPCPSRWPHTLGTSSPRGPALCTRTCGRGLGRRELGTGRAPTPGMQPGAMEQAGPRLRCALWHACAPLGAAVVVVWQDGVTDYAHAAICAGQGIAPVAGCQATSCGMSPSFCRQSAHQFFCSLDIVGSRRCTYRRPQGAPCHSPHSTCSCKVQ